MKKIIRLTESDLTRIVKRVINEQKNKVDPDVKKVEDLIRNSSTSNSQSAIYNIFNACNTVFKKGISGAYNMQGQMYDVFNAIDGGGTEEADIYGSFKNIGGQAENLCTLVGEYKNYTKRDLYVDLKGDISEKVVWDNILTSIKKGLDNK